MQSVIVAGGLGTRLRPITYEVPKSMVRVNGKPFLEHQIQRLESGGIKTLLLCIGYLGEQIREYFGDGSRFGVNIKYSVEEKPLGTGGALKNAEKELEKEFILLNGDTVTQVDYKKLMEIHKSSGKTGLVLLYDNSERIAANNISLGKDGLVTAYSKKSSIGMTHVDAGVYVFNKKVLSLIPKNRKVSLEAEIFPKLIKQKELLGCKTKQRFYDMGTPERLKKMEEILR